MKNKNNNLKSMSDLELKKELVVLEDNVRVIRFKTEGSRSKNVKELASLRKQIARVLTFLNQKNAKKY